jgi:carbonic anhydrase
VIVPLQRLSLRFVQNVFLGRECAGKKENYSITAFGSPKTNAQCIKTPVRDFGFRCSAKYRGMSLKENHMNNLDSMLKRNKDFAAQQTAAGTLMPWLPRAMPNVKATIIGCADMRVDPAHVLGIEPGEAVVLRNIGGRITPSLVEQLGLLGRIGQVAREVPGGGGEFHLVVLHHTDCGITRLVGDPAMLTHFFQIPEGELNAKAVSDPRASVAVDVALLRTIPALPGEWLISGLVYDVATGLVEIVVPPAPIRSA